MKPAKSLMLLPRRAAVPSRSTPERPHASNWPKPLQTSHPLRVGRPALLFLAATIHLSLFTSHLPAAWSPDTGGDHGGLDWSPAPGVPIAGVHSNVGAFLIPSNVTITVAPYSQGRFGSVAIYARRVEIPGTLDASGKGYGGGGGGGGGGGADQLPEFGGQPGKHGPGGRGIQGGRSGQDGRDGGAFVGGTGGAGGSGSGPFFGLGGPGGRGGASASTDNRGRPGPPGGYLAPGANGDETIDDSLWPGSGGAGAGGGGGGHSDEANSGGGGGGGGGAGGSGGGVIKLYASEALLITGQVRAAGQQGGNAQRGDAGRPYEGPGDQGPGGDGGRGGPADQIESGLFGAGGAGARDAAGPKAGNYSGRGGNGGTGGGGAGGGILLQAPRVEISGSLDVTGGGHAKNNGGTVKIFYGDGGLQYSDERIQRGRLFTCRISDCDCKLAPSGLVGWWPGEGNANDIVSNNHGVLLNGANATAPGKVGQGFTFDGVDDEVNIGNPTSLQITGAISVQAWFKTTAAVENFRTLVSKWWSGPEDAAYALLWGNGKLSFSIARESHDAQLGTDSGQPFNDGVWHHVVGTWDGMAIRIYVDGIERGAGTNANFGPIANINHPLKIGTDDRYAPGTGDRYFNGNIDEVAIWNHALSFTEVAGIYAAGSAGMCKTNPCVAPPSGLVGWWPGDGNARDLVGTNDGTLNNGVTFGAGEVAQAFQLDGLDDYVNLGNGLNLDDMTVMAWVFIDVQRNTNEQRIISKDNYLSGGTRKLFDLQSSSPYFAGYDARPSFYVGSGPDGDWPPNSPYIDAVQSPLPLSDGWHHLAGLRQSSAGRVELYVDGVLVAKDSNVTVSGPIDCDASIVLGRFNTTAPILLQSPFHGKIDEAMVFNRALSSNEIAAIYLAGSAGMCKPTPAPRCVAPPGGLVGWWPGDGDASDAVGTHHGTMRNGAIATAPGFVEQGFYFDGIDDYVDIGPGFDLGDITVEAWVLIDSAVNVGERRIISKDNVLLTGTRKLFTLKSSGVSASGNHGHPTFGALISELRTPADVTARVDFVEAPFALSTGWHHLAGVRDLGRGRLELYVDGLLVAHTNNLRSPGVIDSSVNAVIGTVAPDWESESSAEFFAGMIDEPAIYSRPLTSNEIAAIYAAGRTGKCKPSSIPSGTFIAKGSTWKYRDTGADLGTAWREADFDDSAWASGRAELGYGDDGEATVVSFGPDPNAKFITTYFRHTFAASNAERIPCLAGQLLADDGAAVYLNGVEVFRRNLLAGPVNFNTLAASAVEGADETNFVSFTVDASLLAEGTNVLAVEVHQESATSPDLTFDLELSIPDGPHRAPSITVLTPANGATNYPASAGLRFTVTSSQPVLAEAVGLVLNGADVSASLVITGAATNLVATYPLLASNRFYTALVTASNCLGAAAATVSFDTRVPPPTNSGPCPEIVLLMPTNNATYHPHQAGMTFRVISAAPLSTNNISLNLNNADVSSNLTFTGGPTDWLVSYQGLAPYQVYQGSVTVVDTNGCRATRPDHFDTRPPTDQTNGPPEIPPGLPGDCGFTYIDVVSVEERYFTLTDSLNFITPLVAGDGPLMYVKLASGLLESLQSGCATLTVYGVESSGASDRDFKWEGAISKSAQTVAGFFKFDGFMINGVKQSLIPDIQPCAQRPISRIVHFGGSLTAQYAFDFLVYDYPRRISKVRFRSCRTIVVENGSSQAIEVPVRIAGAVVAGESFGDNDKNYAKAWLKASGGVAGAQFSRAIAVESISAFPEEQSIDETLRFTVSPGRGRHTFNLDISGEAGVEVQAKAGGGRGLLSGSATAGVDFPNSIDVGMFTGPNGGPLPAGVTICDAETREIYVTTAPVVAPIERTATQVRFRAYVIPGHNYVVESSTDLEHWTAVATFNNTSSTFDFTADITSSAPQQFFRVVLE